MASQKSSFTPVVQSPTVTTEATARLLTIQQAASYLAASPWAIRRLLMRRVLPYVKVGKRFNITREDLDAWVDSERAKKLAAVRGAE